MRSFVLALGQLCGGAGVLVIVILVIVFVLKRLLAWLDSLGYITYTGHTPTWGSLGNGLMELQKLVQPQYEYVLEQKEEEKQRKEDEDKAGPPDPVGS